MEAKMVKGEVWESTLCFVPFCISTKESFPLETFHVSWGIYESKVENN